MLLFNFLSLHYVIYILCEKILPCQLGITYNFQIWFLIVYL